MEFESQHFFFLVFLFYFKLSNLRFSRYESCQPIIHEHCEHQIKHNKEIGKNVLNFFRLQYSFSLKHEAFGYSDVTFGNLESLLNTSCQSSSYVLECQSYYQLCMRLYGVLYLHVKKVVLSMSLSIRSLFFIGLMLLDDLYSLMFLSTIFVEYICTPISIMYLLVQLLFENEVDASLPCSFQCLCRKNLSACFIFFLNRENMASFYFYN